jgi:hypothetical protein
MAEVESVSQEPQFAAFRGVDWADKKHMWCLQAVDPLAALTFAHLARVAARIRASPAAEMWRLRALVLCVPFRLAHLVLCAAAIRLRAAADIARLGRDVPLLSSEVNARIAASRRSRSCRSSLTIASRFAMARDCSRLGRSAESTSWAKMVFVSPTLDFGALAHNPNYKVESKGTERSGGKCGETLAELLPLPAPCLGSEGFAHHSFSGYITWILSLAFGVLSTTRAEVGKWALDHAYVSERVKALQRELAEIAEHNRQYFTTKTHSPTDRAQHQELRERVYQIRAELYALLERTAVGKLAA